MPKESERHGRTHLSSSKVALQEPPDGRAGRSASKNSRPPTFKSSRREVIATLVVGAAASAAGTATSAEARQVSSLNAPVPSSGTEQVPGPGTGLLIHMYDRLFFIPAAWLSHFEITGAQSEVGPIEAVTRRMRRKDKRNIQQVMYGDLGDPNLPQPRSRIGKRPIVVAPDPDETYVSAMIAPDLIDRA
jgi:hypothetical protein